MAPRAFGEGKPQLLEVGRISRSHGLSGEVVVALVTNRTERLLPGGELTCYLVGTEPRHKAPGSAPLPVPRVLKVTSSQAFQGRYLVRFQGIDTREAADALRGAMLAAPAIEDPEALFVHDLVGSEVVEADGTCRGTVVAVQANPASDLLVLADGSLVPLRFVTGRDEGRLVVEVPPGLFE